MAIAAYFSRDQYC